MCRCIFQLQIMRWASDWLWVKVHMHWVRAILPSSKELVQWGGIGNGVGVMRRPLILWGWHCSCYLQMYDCQQTRSDLSIWVSLLASAVLSISVDDVYECINHLLWQINTFLNQMAKQEVFICSTLIHFSLRAHISQTVACNKSKLNLATASSWQTILLATNKWYIQKLSQCMH